MTRLMARAFALLWAVACASPPIGATDAATPASDDAGRYAHLRPDGGCYEAAAALAALDDVYRRHSVCLTDLDCELRNAENKCVHTTCRAAIAKTSCAAWRRDFEELEYELCDSLPTTCAEVVADCFSPLPTRARCLDGGCEVVRFDSDAGVPACSISGCASMTCP